MSEVLELKKKLKDYLLDLHEEVVGEAISGELLHKQAQDMQRDVQVGLRSDARGLKQTHKERELGKEELVRKQRRAHDRACYDVRREYERRVRDCKQQYDHDARVLRDRLDARRKAAVAELEERKLAHTARVMREHEHALKTIREYFVDITHNNLEKIKELKVRAASPPRALGGTSSIIHMPSTGPAEKNIQKARCVGCCTAPLLTPRARAHSIRIFLLLILLQGLVAERRRADEQDLVSIRKLARENKAMALPLKQANEDLYQLGEQLKEHEADKESLRQVTASLLVVEHDGKGAAWERDLLTARLERAEAEVADLQKKYLEATASVDQKNGFERLLLERRIKATKGEIDAREAQMHHVLVDVAKVQSQAVRQITDRPNPLEGKAARLQGLRDHMGTLDATYRAMLAAVAGKLEEFGIAPNEMGFEPRENLLDFSNV